MKVLLDIISEVVILFKLSLINLLKISEEREFTGSGKPIIFLGGVWGFWPKKGLGGYLKKHNLRAYLFDYFTKTQDIDKNITKLHKFIAENKLSEIIIVGHSLGGLMAVAYCNKYGWSQINKVIAVCAPFKGVRRFGLFDRLINKDIRKTSSFLSNLNRQKIPSEKIICVYGKWDEFMTNKSCHLEGATNIEIDSYGHNNTLAIKKLKFVYDKYLVR